MRRDLRLVNQNNPDSLDNNPNNSNRSNYIYCLLWCDRRSKSMVSVAFRCMKTTLITSGLCLYLYSCLSVSLCLSLYVSLRSIYVCIVYLSTRISCLMYMYLYMYLEGFSTSVPYSAWPLVTLSQWYVTLTTLWITLWITLITLE